MVNCKTLLIAAAAQGSFLAEWRPDAVGYVDNDAGDVRCHYQRENLSARCSLVFEAIEEARDAQTAIGWPGVYPDDGNGGSDALDVYLNDDADGGAYVQSPYTDADPDDGRRGAWSYMVIDPSIDQVDLGSYVAHEFNHVMQFALDFDEPSLPVWEGAATRAEEVTYPEGNWGRYAVPDYQATPWASMLHDGYWLWDRFEIWSYYEYGSVLWFDDLREEHGVDAPTLWWAMSEDKPGNDIDVIAAYEATTGDAKQAWIDFGIRRAHMGTDAAPDWAKEMYPNAKLAIDGEVGIGTDYTFDPGVADWGFGGVDVLEDGVIELQGDDAVEWAIVNATTGVEITADPIVAAGDVVLLFNFGVPDFSGNDTPRLRELTVGMTAAPEDTGPFDTGPDDTDPPDDEDPKGCGCASQTGGAAPAAALILGGLLLVRRRR